jgi:periplasmic protein TonB
MPRNLVLAILFSITFHGCLFLLKDITPLKNKTNFSKKKGQAAIRATISIIEQEKSKPQIVEHRKKSSEKKVKQQKKKQSSKAADKTLAKKNQGQNTLISKYLFSIRNAILKNKTKSRKARRLKLQGSVKLKFTISRPNAISNIKIIESSLFAALDQSAISSVEAVTSFPIIPSNIQQSSLTLVFVMKYE